jgi:pimeloyl-ACP methyl ester carboxylesterase
MKKGCITVVMLAAGLFSLSVRADVLVLVHGYLAGASSWDDSGVTTLLQQHDWQRAGVYTAGPAGVQLIPATGMQARDKFYAVDLPSEAPVLVQVAQLNAILDAIGQSHKGEPVILVGHSAGGVVARAALVLGNHHNVQALITIASPHLGTSRAEQALDATDIPFPLSLVTDFFGGGAYHTAMRSRSLYVDLVRPQPGTLLYWLNAQVHPDIEYFSIVRGPSQAGWGDYIVPTYSQDMNNVPALRGRSSLINVPVSHGLEPVDGSAILDVLAQLG